MTIVVAGVTIVVAFEAMVKVLVAVVAVAAAAEGLAGISTFGTFKEAAAKGAAPEAPRDAKGRTSLGFAIIGSGNFSLEPGAKSRVF